MIEKKCDGGTIKGTHFTQRRSVGGSQMDRNGCIVKCVEHAKLQDSELIFEFVALLTNMSVL